MMSIENQKATAFVSRLLQNPALKPLNPLLREEQILQFLQMNARKLYKENGWEYPTKH